MAVADVSSTRPSDSRFPQTATFVGKPPTRLHLGGMTQYDVAIIGGGAAGLSAALVLARARRNVLVIDAGAPRNGPATHMHGYLSRDGMPPAELLAAGRHEVRSYGGEIVDGTVTDLVPDGTSGFWALLADGRRISARRLMVTTGLSDELPDIPGLRDRWARDVLHCPYCHGHEVADRQLGVARWQPGRGPLRPDRSPVDPRPRLLHPARPPHRHRTNRSGRPGHRRRRRHHRPARHRRHRPTVRRADARGLRHPPRRAVRATPLRPEQHPARRPRRRASTPTAGSPWTPPAAPPSRECGRQATSSTRAPRSSPPQAPPPRLPSR